MMGMLFVMLDIVSAIGVVVTLNLVQKYNKAWLGYGMAAFLFTLVMLHSSLPGMTLMGVVLTVTGIKNYLRGRK
jgi:hypothetical protein